MTLVSSNTYLHNFYYSQNYHLLFFFLLSFLSLFIFLSVEQRIYTETKENKNTQINEHWMHHRAMCYSYTQFFINALLYLYQRIWPVYYKMHKKYLNANDVISCTCVYDRYALHMYVHNDIAFHMISLLW